MKYKRIFLIIGILFLVGLTFSLFFRQLRAANNNPGLTISPPTFDITAFPNQENKNTVRLSNWSDKPLSIGVHVKNFSAQGEEGEVTITSENIPYSLSPWVKVVPANIILQPHTDQVFTFTITPPANAEPGGHFGAIVFSTIPKKDLTQTGTFISQEVASLLLVTIPGDVIERANIYTFTSDKNFYEFGPVNFTAEVRNESSVHIRPIGAIVITDIIGQKFQAPIDVRNILPNALRKIHGQWDTKLLIGPYTAKLILSYGSKNQTITNSTKFWGFPWRYGLVIVGVLIFLYLIRKRLWKAIKALATGK